MRQPGGADLLVAVRESLLDALEALAEHRQSVVVIGAQAVYLHTGDVAVALAEATKDSDLMLDARGLSDHPLVEEAMTAAGFVLDPTKRQPGAWLSAKGIPVDLMVPESMAGAGGTGARSARIPPHGRHAARRARGLEASAVDQEPMEVRSLAEVDQRRFTANVAGPGGLLVAKLHKLGERSASDPRRLADKDAHDVYRLLVAVDTEVLAGRVRHLAGDPLAGPATRVALRHLETMFAAGPTATCSVMAGRAEEGVGEPETVAAAVSFLAADLLAAVGT